MLRFLGTTLAIVLATASAAQASDYSVTLTSTPVQVIPSAPQARLWMRLINVGLGDIWCSRSLANKTAPQTAGAYNLAPNGGTEQLPNPPRVFAPQEAVWCMSPAGSGALTAEALQY